MPGDMTPLKHKHSPTNRIDTQTIGQVFTPVLMGVREEMRRCVSPAVGRGHGAALRALRSLCDMRAGPRHTLRPICSLIARLPSLCPDAITTAPGREIARTSFLGPFFAVSCSLCISFYVCQQDSHIQRLGFVYLGFQMKTYYLQSKPALALD